MSEEKLNYLNYHVVPKANKKWAVRRTGNRRATRIYKTKTEAVLAGIKMAKNRKTILYIHGEDGRICNRIEHYE